MITINLQLFADAGTLVNATGNYVDAYTGSTQAFEGKNTMSPGMKTYYNTELLENARPTMYYAQLAEKVALPAGKGKSVEWRKWNTFEKASQLQEGVIPTGQKFGQTSIVGTISQYGTYAAITDELELRHCDDVIVGCAEEMGASASQTQEELIRDALLTNTNVMYCDNVNKDGTIASTPTSCAQMEATDEVMCKLTSKAVNKAATILKKSNAPRINGKFVAVIHPSVAYDLRDCDEWIEADKYAAVTELFNGEIGELHGVRFVESTNAPILGGTDYKNKAGTVTYATYFFANKAFGIVDPEGGALQMIVHNKDEAGGPLDQFSTVGYKFSTETKVLYPERLLRVMSCSSYSAIDEAN